MYLLMDALCEVTDRNASGAEPLDLIGCHLSLSKLPYSKYLVFGIIHNKS